MKEDAWQDSSFIRLLTEENGFIELLNICRNFFMFIYCKKLIETKPTTIMRTQLFAAFLFISIYAYGQPLTLLKKIGDDSPDSQSGLGQGFYARILEDGHIYFYGSYDGFLREMWKSDGTPDGTTIAFDEHDSGEWSLYDFVHEGIFVQNNDDELKFYNALSGTFTDLGTFDDVDFLKVAPFGVGRYIYLCDKQDTAQVWISDMTAQGTYKLGNIGEYHFTMNITGSEHGAVIYTTSPSSDLEGIFVDPVSEELIPLIDYFSPHKTFTQFGEVFIYDQYIFFTGRENGFDKPYVYNVLTQEFYTSSFLAELIDIIPYENDLIILTKRYLARFSKTNNTLQIRSDEVNSFSRYTVHDETLYFIGESQTPGQPQIHAYDLEANTITKLDNSGIGSINYYTPITFHKDELYFTRHGFQFVLLMKYDFENNTAKEIDSLEVEGGGGENALVEVNDVLLVSKSIPGFGHELFYLDAASNTLLPYPEMPQIGVFPNPCHNQITINTTTNPQDFIDVFTMNGELIGSFHVKGGVLKTNTLQAGNYYGILNQGKSKSLINFIKN